MHALYLSWNPFIMIMTALKSINSQMWNDCLKEKLSMFCLCNYDNFFFCYLCSIVYKNVVFDVWWIHHIVLAVHSVCLFAILKRFEFMIMKYDFESNFMFFFLLESDFATIKKYRCVGWFLSWLISSNEFE